MSANRITNDTKRAVLVKMALIADISLAFLSK
jgi:hypothetical protein